MDEVFDSFATSADQENELLEHTENLGQYLQRHREASQISVEELSWATKVKKEYLLAMEAGDFSLLPGEIFAKGYLRSYSQYLGMDTQATIDKYNMCKEQKCVVPAKDVTLSERVSIIAVIFNFLYTLKKLLTGRDDLQVY